MITMDKQRRRRLLALISLACLLTATYLCASLVITSVKNAGDGDDVAQSRQQLQQRQRLLTATTSSPPINKRVRTHKVLASMTIPTNDPNSASAREGGGGVGILARDSQGLPVEVASWPASFESASSPASTATMHQQTKIINGISFSRASHPYIVRLHWTNPGTDADKSKYISFCGGSLISPNIVLTAAHCLGKYEKYVDIYDVTTGEPRTYRILESLLHPNYDGDAFGYDFGLLLIESTHLEVAVTKDDTNNDGEEYWSLVADDGVFDWENAPPIVRLHRYSNGMNDGTTTSTTKSTSGRNCKSLSDRESNDVTTLTVIGYGSTSYSANSGSGNPSYSSLQGADVHYVSNDECNDLYLKARDKTSGTIITDDQMCASDVEEGQDACSGDSGGPLVTRLTNADDGSSSLWTQVGIVSWGIGCALSKYPGVYSRVAHEIEWIEREICGVDGREGKQKGGGLSPMSCVVDESSGERRLRDYAMEAAALKQNSGSSARREEVIEMDIEKISSNRNAVTRREKVQLSFSDPKNQQQQKQQQSEPCELLEGPSITYEEVVTTTLTPRPTKRPTKSPMTNPPTREKRNPTADNDTPTSIITAATCSSGNQLDVNSFPIGNNNRRRNCNWVRRKCRKRCGDYSGCCPETCSRSKCNQ
mmetsp:Transcript_12767/g.27737  ORF Transcript_12767/g.27737 Transcript_12767/m.27737 type:complete len:650 (-) Transcript_12767:20-1969(-)